MHTLYFVGHFIGLQTYEVPYKIKSVHLLVIKVIITKMHISKLEIINLQTDLLLKTCERLKSLEFTAVCGDPILK
jgi:hypothetical protein